MAHFAKLSEDSIVEQVIVVSNQDCIDESGMESEEIGIAFCNNLIPGLWVQTSYNAKIRKNYAGIGYTYDLGRDAFIPPKPEVENGHFILDEETCLWTLLNEEIE